MNFVMKEPIHKGWSSDKKYCVTSENGMEELRYVFARSENKRQ